MRRNAFSRFQSNEIGAITVEWVVLTALITGIIIASKDSFAAALGIHSDNISEELTNSEIVRAGANGAHSDTFGDGAGRWTGGGVYDVPGFGEILGHITGTPGGEQSVSHDFIMASNVDESVITFDLFSFDGIGEGDAGIFYINGVEVGRVTGGDATLVTSSVDGVTIETTTVSTGDNLGGYGDPNTATDSELDDTHTIVKITLDDPDDAVTFGFGSTANQGENQGDHNYESYGIDNFSITGVDQS
ncbi:Flp family type IVb pilin [Jannaschia aquimarina]|uniref:Uncharacterized protein n=1 Tax=Jannaschia aquimarina TaxID=935700 RepID=A0A0D1EME0_9RHOB|nr:hypothetical protein [Jannaschia aquimarina]KIT16840.1 hypothetical protein jaqu_13360 [Jannaschia aquimarina]SNT13205.1 hypothetical protein SAMN05421775_106111 [Jannaschia aquimarina]